MLLETRACSLALIAIILLNLVSGDASGGDTGAFVLFHEDGSNFDTKQHSRLGRSIGDNNDSEIATEDDGQQSSAATTGYNGTKPAHSDNSTTHSNHVSDGTSSEIDTAAATTRLSQETTSNDWTTTFGQVDATTTEWVTTGNVEVVSSAVTDGNNSETSAGGSWTTSIGSNETASNNETFSQSSGNVISTVTSSVDGTAATTGSLANQSTASNTNVSVASVSITVPHIAVASNTPGTSTVSNNNGNVTMTDIIITNTTALSLESSVSSQTNNTPSSTSAATTIHSSATVVQTLSVSTAAIEGDTTSSNIQSASSRNNATSAFATTATGTTTTRGAAYHSTGTTSKLSSLSATSISHSSTTIDGGRPLTSENSNTSSSFPKLERKFSGANVAEIVIPIASITLFFGVIGVICYRERRRQIAESFLMLTLNGNAQSNQARYTSM